VALRKNTGEEGSSRFKNNQRRVAVDWRRGNYSAIKNTGRRKGELRCKFTKRRLGELGCKLAEVNDVRKRRGKEEMENKQV